MLDTSTLSFGGIFSGNTLDKSFMISAFKDVSGTITITAPTGYTLSTNGTDFGPSATITADPSFVGRVVSVRFTPADSIPYNGDLTVVHATLTPDYGNSVPNATAGTISLTGNGKVIVAGAPATVTWPMFAGTAIVFDATTDGAVSATSATLTGLVNKNVANGAARFDSPDGVWPMEAARNAGRYVEFTVPVTTGSLTLDTISLGAGSGGGSNMRWDVVYSLSADFSSPTELGTSLSGVKDTLTTQQLPQPGRQRHGGTDALPARLSLQHQRRCIWQEPDARERRRLRRHQLSGSPHRQTFTQIVLCGAEFTRVYANEYGTHVVASDNAIPVPETPLARMAMEKKIKNGEEPSVAPGTAPARPGR